MKRILYIEDELDWHFILNSFSDTLSESEKRLLQNSENDEETILAALKNNMRLEVIADFAEALDKIHQQLDEYDLLFVDRNLFGDGRRYQKADIPSNFPLPYSEAFDSREGDFLLHYVRYKRYDIENKFYMITGNTDEIRSHPEFEYSLSPTFKRHNVIVKGSGDTEKIRTIIGEIEDRLNRAYLDILHEYVGEEITHKFLNVLKAREHEARISDNLKDMRTIYEAILKETIERIPGMKTNCIERGRLRNNWLNWLESQGYINSIQHHFFQSIYKIGSDFGAHYNEQKARIYKPTLDTVNALIYQLKDIIVWFGGICKTSAH